ncbi:MAG: protein phosphatase 2C domain-containing protein [Verrucomicrobia bacterium]|nr:protein phosphatase 2C domain-containing protein [Verrucomicrobiota bacterium]
MPLLRAAALTDIGRVRRNNEDRYLCDEALRVFGIADGVGGLPGGAEAAQQTVDEILAALHRQPPDAEPDLVAIVQQTNETVSILGHRISPAMGIGTTLTFGCVRGNTFKLAHVGDSRAYLLRKGEFMRITEDHSVENEARLRRAKGEVVYYHEANRNALTRCIGQPTPPEVDLISRPLVVGDRYLFCTDGVTRMIPDSEIGELVAQADTPEEALKAIVSLAVRRGGPDNATGVMVFVDGL